MISAQCTREADEEARRERGRLVRSAPPMEAADVREVAAACGRVGGGVPLD